MEILVQKMSFVVNFVDEPNFFWTHTCHKPKDSQKQKSFIKTGVLDNMFYENIYQRIILAYEPYFHEGLYWLI